jgi:aspartyl/asparaginyl beta-hydroxylase (cupin superfamily)
LAHEVEQTLRRGDHRGALRLLDVAEAQAPGDIGLKMQRAIALRIAGDLWGALETLNGALSLDPYNFMALLAKGAMVERLSGKIAAADIYRNALKIAPSEVPPPLLPAMARAEAVVQDAADEAEAILMGQLADLLADCSSQGRRRAEETIRIFTGKQRPYHSEALLLHYPGLPAIPFYDRAFFPWLDALEAESGAMQGDLEPLLQADDGFSPYMTLPPEVPANQWQELNHSARWSSYYLWRNGELQTRAARECPRTVAALAGAPLARQPEFAPTAVFSALDRRTHIPPHTGSTNARLLVHLPLVVPGPSRFRVGGETRVWKAGEAWVFDDTIEHEAWNDADSRRIILIFDIWNPHLDPVEREIVTRMLTARKRMLNA